MKSHIRKIGVPLRRIKTLFIWIFGIMGAGGGIIFLVSLFLSQWIIISVTPQNYNTPKQLTRIEKWLNEKAKPGLESRERIRIIGSPPILRNRPYPPTKISLKLLNQGKTTLLVNNIELIIFACSSKNITYESKPLPKKLNDIKTKYDIFFWISIPPYYHPHLKETDAEPLFVKPEEEKILSLDFLIPFDLIFALIAEANISEDIVFWCIKGDSKSSMLWTKESMTDISSIKTFLSGDYPTEFHKRLYEKINSD